MLSSERVSWLSDAGAKLGGKEGERKKEKHEETVKTISHGLPLMR